MMEWKKFGVICVLGLTLMAAAGCSDGSKNATSAGTPATQQAQTTKPQGVEKTLYRKPKDGSQKLVAVKTTVQGGYRPAAAGNPEGTGRKTARRG